jgi:uncharacterized protein YbjT (DUF2867 family)
MSLLLMGLEPGLGEPLITRLISQDDEVRVIEADPVRGAHWKELGAYVARGEAGDVDLVERAAQNVRTIVVLERAHEDLEAAVETAVEGASLAGVERIVVCAAAVSKSVVEVLSKSGIDYVALSSGGRRRVFGRGTVSETTITEAVDAADDLAGPVRLELDLSQREAWISLGLS